MVGSTPLFALQGFCFWLFDSLASWSRRTARKAVRLLGVRTALHSRNLGPNIGVNWSS